MYYISAYPLFFPCFDAVASATGRAFDLRKIFCSGELPMQSLLTWNGTGNKNNNKTDYTFLLDNLGEPVLEI